MALADRFAGTDQINRQLEPEVVGPLPSPTGAAVGGTDFSNLLPGGGITDVGATGGTNLPIPGIQPLAIQPQPSPTGDLLSQLIGNIGSGVGGVASGAPPTGGAGGFTPQGAGNLDFDPALREALLTQLGGGGGPSFQQIVEGQFDPLSALLDRQFDDARQSTLQDLTRRGVLQSGETTGAISDLNANLAAQKGGLLGNLASQFNRDRQQAIQQAIGTFGILEGNRISAKATISSANIGAAAQVRSAALSSGATVQAAQIGAQARLQESGLNVSLALEKLQQDRELTLVELGVDPIEFQNDPAVRDAFFKQQEDFKQQEQLLIEAQIDELNRRLLEGAV